MLHTFLKTVAGIIVAPLVSVLGFAGYSLQPNQPVVVQQTPAPIVGASNIIDTPIALFATSLASQITPTATTMTLVSATTGDGSTLASSTYSFIIDEGQSDQEFVRADCTGTTCINMARGLSMIDGQTSITSLAQQHRRGQSVKITDAPLLLVTTNLINGVNGFPNKLSYTSAVATSSFTSAQQIIDKGYADYLAFNGAGVINATAAAKGTVQIGTGAQAAASTGLGSTGASLTIPTSIATSTYNQSTAANVVIVTGSGGQIDSNFLATTTAPFGVKNYGNCSAGNVTIAANSTTTLTGITYYNNLTVNGALVPNGYPFFVCNTLSGSGIISARGNDGGAGVAFSGSTGGAGGTAGATTTSGYFQPGSIGTVGTAGGNAAGGNGGNSTASMAIAANSLSGTGGKGGVGSGGGGGSAGTVANPGAITAAKIQPGIILGLTSFGLDLNLATSTTLAPYAGGSGGTGGSGGGANGSATGGSGGGGGGSAGGIIGVSAQTISGTFIMRAAGGNGGAGATAGALGSGTGGGGGGGAGGIVITVSNSSATYTGTVDVAGGTGGAAGTSGGGDGTQQPGASGTAGAYYQIH